MGRTLGPLSTGLSCLCALGAAAPAVAAEVVPGELIVGYERGVGSADRAAARDRVEVRFDADLPLPRTELVVVKRRHRGDEAAAAEALERLPGVQYAEPNHVMRTAAIPNDPLFRESWGLSNILDRVLGSVSLLDADIDAPEAWEVIRGAPQVPVAILDTGVDYRHPDLAQNIWVNHGEPAAAASNGRDDDGNGYIDDLVGWDFVDGDSAPSDELTGHGTHVAGIAGARGNNGVGISGVQWVARLMALRVCDGGGGCNAADTVRAIDYAAANGARIVNMSFAGTGESRAVGEAIARASQVLFVAAAGNDGVDVDRSPRYPCDYELANVVCVGASDSSDRLAGFSNFGAASVDLVAPGKNIHSTYVNRHGSGYSIFEGTSSAAPVVAGAAALVWATQPGLSAGEIRRRLLAGADRVAGVAGRVASGRLNLARSLGLDPAGIRPITRIVKGPPRKTEARKVRFKLRSNIADGRFDCRLDRGRWSPCGAVHRTARLALGRHTFRARARDGTGLRDQSPAKARFRITD